MPENPTCAGGHSASQGAAFCGRCGEPLLQGAGASVPPAATMPPGAVAPLAIPPGATAPSGGYAPDSYAVPAVQYVPVTRGTNGLAIASMVLGILWLYWVGSILALVFGYIAMRQIKERNESGRGMAVAGVVLGWIGAATGAVVVILVIVAAARSGSN